MQFAPWDNPMGTDGFEFIEYAAPDPAAMGALFERMGFVAIAKHRHKNVPLYRQGEHQLHRQCRTRLVRAALRAAARAQHLRHRVSRAGRAPGLRARACAGRLGLRRQRGPGRAQHSGDQGHRRSLIYLVDKWRGKGGAKEGDIGNIGFFDVDFEPLRPGASLNPPGHGLTYIDHLTHNVHRGRMAEWAEFYERLFNFREVRYFDIEGQVTGVKSKAMTSPCGKIRIPINEEGNEKAGQIQEYLDRYHGEGIQHIALGSTDLSGRWTRCGPAASSCSTRSTPTTSWSTGASRATARTWPSCRQRKVLIDGKAGELLLQIFSENQLGPIFFEFIQRKGDQGFGEGNFKALFESIELDQMRRGVLAQDMTAVVEGVNQGVAPVTYGQGDRPPRGDYARAGADYTCEQDYGQYTEADHDTYRRLHARQLEQLPGLACDEFIDAVQQLGAPDRIPRFDDISERLLQSHRLADRRRARADSGRSLLCAAGRSARFPVTDWMRKPEEFDYVVEPDVFHDLFGHVPLLFNPTFADYMQAYGAGGLKASRLDACELLARLYWYTVEFGLIDTPKGLRAYGAGILSARPANCATASPSRDPARGLRLAAPDAQPLPHRHLPGRLLRDRHVPAAVRRHRAGLHGGVRPGARDDRHRRRNRRRRRAAGRARVRGRRVDAGSALPANGAARSAMCTCATAAR